jgi:hypothetical protein
MLFTHVFIMVLIILQNYMYTYTFICFFFDLSNSLYLNNNLIRNVASCNFLHLALLLLFKKKRCTHRHRLNTKSKSPKNHSWDILLILRLKATACM